MERPAPTADQSRLTGSVEVHCSARPEHGDPHPFEEGFLGKVERLSARRRRDAPEEAEAPPRSVERRERVEELSSSFDLCSLSPPRRPTALWQLSERGPFDQRRGLARWIPLDRELIERSTARRRLGSQIYRSSIDRERAVKERPLSALLCSLYRGLRGEIIRGAPLITCREHEAKAAHEEEVAIRRERES